MYTAYTPHQRAVSGKLRVTSKLNISESTAIAKEKDPVYVGIENSQQLKDYDSELEIQHYYQTPRNLIYTQISVLSDIVRGLHGNPETYITSEWRNTWNIGIWKIGDKVSLSMNLMQPNIANCWVNIVNCNQKAKDKLGQLRAAYIALGLEKSTIKIVPGKGRVQVQGRWSLVAANVLLNEGLITEDDLQIASLNITQSRIFGWLIIEGETGRSTYLCLFTRQSGDVICRYLPEWCADIEEAGAGCNISIRLRNPEVKNDASQLQVNNAGSLQYNGRRESLGKLYEAIYESIHTTVKSVYLNTLLQSFEFRKYKSET